MNIDVNHVIMVLSLAVPNCDLLLVFGITPDPACVWDES